MFLTTHTAAGLLMGALFPNPAAAFPMGVLSHAVLDMIPHEHEKDLILTYPKDKKHNTESLGLRKIISAIDLACVPGIVALSLYFTRLNEPQPYIFICMLFGIAGGLIPDCIIMLTFKFDNRFLRWFFDLHNRIHFVIARTSVSRKISIGYQVVLICLLLYITYIIIN